MKNMEINKKSKSSKQSQKSVVQTLLMGFVWK